MQFLILDNIQCLEQGIDLLQRLDPDVYTRTCPQCFNSNIGGHVRHNIDHYASFLKGYRSGNLDYDDRERDTNIETDPDCAIVESRRMAEELQKIAPEDFELSLAVRMDSGSVDAANNSSQSTVRRELQFLLSHTVHHYALIAVICNFHGMTVPPDFGVAPSTLKHQQSPCAL